MELVAGAETMALDGGQGSKTTGRPPMCGMTTEGRAPPSSTTSCGRRRSCRSTRTTCWSTGSFPVAPDRTTVICQLSVRAGHPDGPARGFDPADAIAFWDLTNSQDWHVCEMQQRGTKSTSWISGRYSNQEASVHAFDQMIAERYAGLEFSALRTVRERYDQPVPKKAPIGQLDAGTRAHDAASHDPHEHEPPGRPKPRLHNEHTHARTTAPCQGDEIDQGDEDGELGRCVLDGQRRRASAPRRHAMRSETAVIATITVEIALISGVTPNLITP